MFGQLIVYITMNSRFLRHRHNLLVGASDCSTENPYRMQNSAIQSNALESERNQGFPEAVTESLDQVLVKKASPVSLASPNLYKYLSFASTRQLGSHLYILLQRKDGEEWQSLSPREDGQWQNLDKELRLAKEPVNSFIHDKRVGKRKIPWPNPSKYGGLIQ